MKNRIFKALALAVSVTMAVSMTGSFVYAEDTKAAVEEAVGEVVEEAKAAAAEVAEKAGEALSETADQVNAAVGEAIENAQGTLSEAAGQLDAAVSDVLEKVDSALTEAAGEAGEAVEEAAEEAGAAAEEAVEEAGEAVEEAAEEAGEAVEEAAEEEEEDEDTGVAPETPGEVYQPSVDPAAIKDQAILVVSFGTSFNQNRSETICAVENALAEAFPEYDVRRAFTAQIIIDKLARRDDVIIDNVEQALDRAVADGVKTLVVQPTHLMHGFEYNDLSDALAEYADAFEKLVLAEPLLTTDDDFSRVADAITAATESYDDGETAICFMGHGTEADSNVVYGQMQEVLTGKEKANYYVGTVEATPSLDDVVAAVKEGSYKKVVLEPLMVVAGDHANNDMAGDDDDTWKSVFEAEGYEVECVLRGLGSFEEVQKLYVEHTQAAIDSLA